LAATISFYAHTPIIKIIFIAGLVAGTMDIIGALTVYAVLLHKASVMLILQRIASAAIGPAALRGGWATAWCGLLFIISSPTVLRPPTFCSTPICLCFERITSKRFTLRPRGLADNESNCPALNENPDGPISMGCGADRHRIADALHRVARCLHPGCLLQKREREAGSLELATASSSGGEQGARSSERSGVVSAIKLDRSGA